jgi:hypothetical protein
MPPTEVCRIVGPSFRSASRSGLDQMPGARQWGCLRAADHRHCLLIATSLGSRFGNQVKERHTLPSAGSPRSRQSGRWPVRWASMPKPEWPYRASRDPAEPTACCIAIQGVAQAMAAHDRNSSPTARRFPGSLYFNSHSGAHTGWPLVCKIERCAWSEGCRISMRDEQSPLNVRRPGLFPADWVLSLLRNRGRLSPKAAFLFLRPRQFLGNDRNNRKMIETASVLGAVMQLPAGRPPLRKLLSQSWST